MTGLSGGVVCPCAQPLQVFITSSNFSNNAAMSGTGGALSLIADNMHQQVRTLLP